MWDSALQHDALQMAEPVVHAQISIATFCKAMWRNPDLEGLLSNFVDPWQSTDTCNPDL